MTAADHSIASKRRIVSVVIPVLNEQENVGPMSVALQEMAEGCPDIDFEFLFVDDGSRDATFERLGVIHSDDGRFKVARLSRNFGSHIAAAAGLQFCSGDGAVIMAADLQDHPREIPRFIEKWREGYHVVLTVRASRQEAGADAFLSRLFGKVIRRIALPNYPPGGTGSFCLIDRLVINALNAFPERNRMTFGLILYAGFRQTSIPYDRLQRRCGHSKWSFRQKVKLMVDTVVSFSSAPIQWMSLFGLTVAAVSFAYSGQIAFDRLVYGSPVPGWTSIAALIGILGGLQLTMLGILGEYLWRTLDDTRRRPLFFVQDTIGAFPRPDGNAPVQVGPPTGR